MFEVSEEKRGPSRVSINAEDGKDGNGNAAYDQGRQHGPQGHGYCSHDLAEGLKRFDDPQDAQHSGHSHGAQICAPVRQHGNNGRDHHSKIEYVPHVREKFPEPIRKNRPDKFQTKEHGEGEFKPMKNSAQSCVVLRVCIATPERQQL